MLKRVKIQGYKSLKDVEVQLQPLTVLFGPNASGKSNFLDALQLLSRIATERTLNNAFLPPYRGTPLESFTFGLNGIQELRLQEKASFSIEIDVEISASVIDAVNQQIQEMEPETTPPKGIEEKYLRYFIEIEIAPRAGILHLSKESLLALDTNGLPIKVEPFLDLRYKEGKTYLSMEGKRPVVYGRSLDYSIISQPYNPYFHTHLVAIRQELMSWFFFYLEPRERMRIPTAVREVRHIGLMGEELATYLNTLQALDERQFDAVEKALHVIIPSISDIKVNVNDEGKVELQLVKDHIPISARLLSEGTLRVLGLLALGGAKEPATLVCFEEPETGIQADRLDLIASLLTNLAEEDSQVIVTTHSPVLLDLLPEKSLCIVRSQSSNSVIEPFTVWKAKQRKLRVGRDAAVSEHLLRGSLYA